MGSPTDPALVMLWGDQGTEAFESYTKLHGAQGWGRRRVREVGGMEPSLAPGTGIWEFCCSAHRANSRKAHPPGSTHCNEVGHSALDKV